MIVHVFPNPNHCVAIVPKLQDLVQLQHQVSQCISQGYHCVKDSLAMTHSTVSSFHPHFSYYSGNSEPYILEGVQSTPIRCSCHASPLLQHYVICCTANSTGAYDYCTGS